MPSRLRSRGLAQAAGILVLVTALAVAASGQSPGALAPDPTRFEAEIAAFEAEDRATPPPANAALFVGSSSIRYWDLAQAFPGRPAIKRGFGGSHVSDSIYYADRIIVRYQPALIVFYAGDADVAAGKTSVQIGADYQALIALIHARLANTRIIVIGTKHSPAHWAHRDVIRRANVSVAALAAADDLLEYVDVESALLGADALPRADYYAENGLNLNERGYAAWTAAVAPVIEQHWPKP